MANPQLPNWTEEVSTGTPVVSVMFSPSSPGRTFAITSDGRLFTTDEVKNRGSWSETGTWRTSSGDDVRQLAVNSQHDGRLYAITEASVARSTTYGISWREIGSGSLPESEFNSIVAHPTEAHTLFLGADSGVYMSIDEGDTWTPYDDDLPNAEVLQIFFENGYLYAVTHGRGLWRRRPC